MNKMKIKIFALFSLIIAFSLVLSSCDSLWDDLGSITISFDSNGGEGTMKPQNFVATVPQALQANTFTRTGYTFAGWATKADASEAEYADKANFTAKEDTTLYAIWSKIPPTPVSAKVAITYVSDHGTCPEAKTVEAGYKLTADDLITLAETGYNFKGWNKSVGDEITADTTITASWKKTWTITYASNKSELNDKLPASKTVDEGYKLTADDLSTLTADGYNFKGWDKSAGLEIKADVTITSNWVKTWKITYVLPSGYSKEPKIVEAGYKLTAEDLPNYETATQYCNFNKNYGDEVTSDLQITGVWEDIVYLDFSGGADLLSEIFGASFNLPGTPKSIHIVKDYTPEVIVKGCAQSPADPNYFTAGYDIDGTDVTLWISGNGHRVYAPDCANLFYDTYKTIELIDLSNFCTSKVTYMDSCFEIGSSNLLETIILSPLFITSSVESMYAMFSGCINLTSIDISTFDVSKVTNVSYMFGYCVGLKTIKFPDTFDISSLSSLNNMFDNCKSLETIDLSSFTNTDNLTSIAGMFENCQSLKSVNLSNFNLSNVTGVNSLFLGNKALTSVILPESLNSGNVTNMSQMFSGCTALTTVDLSNINTENVTNMGSMFKNCSNLTELDLSSFDTKSLKLRSFNSTDWDNLFTGCSSLVTIYATDKFKLGVGNAFEGCSKLVGGAGTACDGINNVDCIYARIDGGPTSDTPGYLTSKQ